MHVDRISKLPGACLFVKASIDSQTNIILGGLLLLFKRVINLIILVSSKKFTKKLVEYANTGIDCVNHTLIATLSISCWCRKWYSKSANLSGCM